MLKISHHHLLTVKPIAINIPIVLITNKHTQTLFANAVIFVVPKGSLRITPFLWLVEPRLDKLFSRDYYITPDLHRFHVASHGLMH